MINYAERGDFTIDVMMYDLPKDVQEARRRSPVRGPISMWQCIVHDINKHKPPGSEIARAGVQCDLQN